MDDIDVRIEKKLAEIRDNKVRLGTYLMEQKQPGELVKFPSIRDGLLNDKYNITDELLQLELQLLRNEDDPNIFPLVLDRKEVLAEIKDKQRQIEEIDREIEVRTKN